MWLHSLLHTPHRWVRWIVKRSVAPWEARTGDFGWRFLLLLPPPSLLPPPPPLLLHLYPPPLLLPQPNCCSMAPPSLLLPPPPRLLLGPPMGLPTANVVESTSMHCCCLRLPPLRLDTGRFAVFDFWLLTTTNSKTLKPVERENIWRWVPCKSPMTSTSWQLRY